MSYLFVNGSPNKMGNTAALAATALSGRDYDQLDLGDLRIFGYGTPFSTSDDDQFDEALAKLRAADTIVFGSPVYWHDLSGILRNFLDRCYGPLNYGELSGKRIALVFQGAGPTQEMLDRGDFTISRFASLYGAEYLGMATSSPEARELSQRL